MLIKVLDREGYVAAALGHYNPVELFAAMQDIAGQLKTEISDEDEGPRNDKLLIAGLIAHFDRAERSNFKDAEFNKKMIRSVLTFWLADPFIWDNIHRCAIEGELNGMIQIPASVDQEPRCGFEALQKNNS